MNEKPKNFWLKERHNPQLGVYWTRCGQLTIKEAKEYENASYGHNIMHRFITEEEYNAKIAELKQAGASVHD